MVDEKDFAVANDKNHHGEINFFVNVRHKTGRVWRHYGRTSIWTDCTTRRIVETVFFQLPSSQKCDTLVTERIAAILYYSSMKNLTRSFCLLIALALAFDATRAFDNAENYDATSETVGWETNGFETPVNQRLSPAGKLIELPGMRPNALALSPDGKLLVTSGLKAELLILDPTSGEIIQHVPMPSDKQQPGTESLSPQILGANLRDKLSFTGLVFSRDGRRIYLSNVNGDIKVFAVGEHSKVSPLFSIPLPSANMPGRKADIPAGIAVSHDGHKNLRSTQRGQPPCGDRCHDGPGAENVGNRSRPVRRCNARQ